MEIVLDLLITYGRYVEWAAGIVLLVITVLTLRNTIRMNRKLAHITDEVNNYINAVTKSEEELERQEKRQKENQIISAVLEEIFP